MSLNFESPDAEINKHIAAIRYYEEEIQSHKRIIARLKRDNANKLLRELDNTNKLMLDLQEQYNEADIDALQDEVEVEANKLINSHALNEIGNVKVTPHVEIVAIATQKGIRPYVMDVFRKNKNDFLTSAQIFEKLRTQIPELSQYKKKVSVAISSILNDLYNHDVLEGKETGIARVKKYRLY